MVSFELTSEQEDIRRMARDFVKKEVIPTALQHDEEEKFNFDLVKKAWDLGLMNTSIPEEFGGPGLDFLTYCLIVEEMSYGCAGVTTFIPANTLGTLPILIGATDEQKARMLKPLVEGPALAAFGLTEPNAGSDIGSMSTTARREGDYYILNGSKCFITNGGVAHQYVIFATVDKSLGVKGVTAFYVPAGIPGVSVGKKEKKMGIRASDTAEVILENVRVPVEDRIGEEGMGARLALGTLDKARVSVGASSVGTAQAALDAAVSYARQRVQFGKAIGSFQAIQFILADIAIGVVTGRNMYYHAAWLCDQNRPFSLESAICKTYCSDMVVKATNEALQVFGGYGYTREYGMEKLVRDARITQIVDGTNQIQRMIIGSQLVKDSFF